MDVPLEVSVKVNQLPPVTENITLQVFALQMDDCTDIEKASNAEIEALTGDSHEYQYDFVNSPVEGGTYNFDFDLDFGQYCFYVKVTGLGGTVVDTSSTDIEVTGKLWPNQVIAGVPGLIFLGLSIFAFVGAQKVGKKVKTMLEDDELTEEQMVLEEVRRKKIVAGPGSPPSSPSESSSSQTKVAGPTNAPNVKLTGPTNVASAPAESVKSGPPPAQTQVDNLQQNLRLPKKMALLSKMLETAIIIVRWQMVAMNNRYTSKTLMVNMFLIRLNEAYLQFAKL